MSYLSLHRLPRLVALLAPVALLGAAELPKMAPTPSKPPPPTSATDRLVDAVIPAYGVRDQSPYRMPSRVSDLYHQIRAFCAEIDARVMMGTLGIPNDQWVVPPVDPANQRSEPLPGARPVLVGPPLLPEQEHLILLVQALAELETEVPLPNQYERWHFENSYRDLERSAEHLAMALSDPRFEDLRGLHRAWKDYYLRLIQVAIVEQALAIIAEAEPEKRRLDLSTAITLSINKGVSVPWPRMSIDLEHDSYPPVFLPSITGWSELSDTARQRFIAQFGVPGQALPVNWPVSEEPQEPILAPEISEPASPEEVIEDAPVSEQPQAAAEPVSEGMVTEEPLPEEPVSEEPTASEEAPVPVEPAPDFTEGMEDLAPLE